MPFLETVAGDALSMLCGSKMILQDGDIGIRSPFASVKVLLSSSTEFKFSIQIASTGPSRTIQIRSPASNGKKVNIITLSCSFLPCRQLIDILNLRNYAILIRLPSNLSLLSEFYAKEWRIFHLSNHWLQHPVCQTSEGQ